MMYIVWMYIDYVFMNIKRQLPAVMITIQGCGYCTYTVKREYLAAIIFGGFSNMTIWQIINLAISNSGISKYCYVFILVTINFGEFCKFANFAK